jgi:lipopolysaccharide biosynthesis glycosyltransferase
MIDTHANETLDLVFSSDDRFAMPLAVSVTSCLTALPAGTKVRLHVMDGGMTERSKAHVERCVAHGAGTNDVSVSWIVPPRDLLPDPASVRYANTKLNETTLYRYLIADLLPACSRRALLLDSDIVAVADVTGLRDAIGPDWSIAAVRDYGIGDFAERFGHLDKPWPFGVGPEQKYFNSGVMGVNLEWWRRENVREQAWAMFRDHAARCHFPGQDALNYVLHGTWGEVDLAWNLQTHGPDRMRRLGTTEQQMLGEPYEHVRRRAKIIHFSGNKPWEQGFTNPDRPAFVEALRRSGWFGPMGLQRWRAGWWAKLIKRQANRRIAGYRNRLLGPRPQTNNSRQTN